MNKELNNMMELFPGHRGRIFDLFQNNDEFRTICYDYWQSKQALLKFRENVMLDKQLESEYSILCAELEDEASRYICSERKY